MPWSMGGEFGEVVFLLGLQVKHVALGAHEATREPHTIMAPSVQISFASLLCFENGQHIHVLWEMLWLLCCALCLGSWEAVHLPAPS